jgi:hypothetical protein
MFWNAPGEVPHPPSNGLIWEAPDPPRNRRGAHRVCTSTRSPHTIQSIVHMQSIEMHSISVLAHINHQHACLLVFNNTSCLLVFNNTINHQHACLLVFNNTSCPARARTEAHLHLCPS